MVPRDFFLYYHLLSLCDRNTEPVLGQTGQSEGHEPVFQVVTETTADRVGVVFANQDSDARNKLFRNPHRVLECCPVLGVAR